MKNLLSILLHISTAFLLVTCSDDTPIRQPESNGSYPIVISSDAFRYILHDGVSREQAALGVTENEFGGIAEQYVRGRAGS